MTAAEIKETVLATASADPPAPPSQAEEIARLKARISVLESCVAALCDLMP